MTVAAERSDGALPKTRIFVSYSRKDMAFADRLEAALKARGVEPLIDRSEIYAFEDWWQRVEALIAQADTVVFVLSPDAAASETALKEVAFAASRNKRFAPIVCRRVHDREVSEALRRLNFIFFDDEARFDESADRLVEALQTDIQWIRRHSEYGEAALGRVPPLGAVAALAGAGRGRALDRRAAGILAQIQARERRPAASRHSRTGSLGRA